MAYITFGIVCLLLEKRFFINDQEVWLCAKQLGFEPSPHLQLEHGIYLMRYQR